MGDFFAIKSPFFIKKLLFFCALSLFTTPSLTYAVQLVDIVAQPWPTATVEKFAFRVCSENRAEIETYLKNAGKPFQNSLVRKIENSFCHIVYQPSAEGFRAKPDFGSVQSLVIQADSKAFALNRERIWGDSFDVLRTLQKLRPELPKTVIIDQQPGFSPAGSVPVKSETMSWTQDFLVSGKTANKEHFVLLPHRIFEGDFAKGERFAPFLEEVSHKIPFANRRSKLSWEGGDLVFLQIPNTDKTLLVYGHTFEKYWAKELSSSEIEFVLKTEFGADEALDGKNLSAHVDYTVLPLDGKRLLFRVPFHQNTKFICDVSGAALKDFKNNLKVTPPRLAELNNRACSSSQIGDLKDLVSLAIQEFNSNQSNWVVNRSLDEVKDEVLAAITRSCSLSDSTCISKLLYSVEGLAKINSSNPRVVQASLNSAVDGISNTMRFASYFTLLEGQLLEMNVPFLQKLNLLREKLVKLGFQLIDVPSPYSEASWAGLSHVNSLVVNKDLFIPSFGLPNFEALVKSEILRQAPDLKVYAIPSLIQISSNGGVHCSVKAVR